MHILIYVLTMLMLFTILTYTRVDAYRNFAAIRAQFEQYTTKTERAFVSKRAVKWFESTAISKKEADSLNADKKMQAFSKLSLYPLVNTKARETEPEEQSRAAKVKGILKNLLNVLYGKADFYREALNRNPDLPELLVAGIMEAADKLSDKQKIANANDLANLNLEDPQLNEVFYKMLKGTQKGDGKGKAGSTYAALTGFIGITKKANVSVYLASRPLLMALSNDEGLVDRILQRRRSLYAEVSHQDAPENAKEVATKHFQDEFKGNFGSIADDFLDFSVTKTNPAGYE